MKVFLIFVGIIAAAFGLGTFLVQHGEELDASSKAYIEENIPPIISTWSRSELLNRSSPQLQQLINEKTDKIDELFNFYSKLGSLKSFEDIEGEAQFTFSTSGNNTTTAYYTATGIFENSDARITIRLTQPSDEWKITHFNVESPFFQKAQK